MRSTTTDVGGEAQNKLKIDLSGFWWRQIIGDQNKISINQKQIQPNKSAINISLSLHQSLWYKIYVPAVFVMLRIPFWANTNHKGL